MRKFQMMMTTVLIGAMCVSSPVFADNGKGHGHGHGHGKFQDRDDDDDREVNVVIVSEHNRDLIRHRIYNDYYDRCPPGLAKKHNGCLPPGHAKRRYYIGRPLPSYVVYEPVPDYWLEELEPVPYGYRYVRVDNDVLLISEASHKVIDAITLLSAVGR